MAPNQVRPQSPTISHVYLSFFPSIIPTECLSSPSCPLSCTCFPFLYYPCSHLLVSNLSNNNPQPPHPLTWLIPSSPTSCHIFDPSDVQTIYLFFGVRFSPLHPSSAMRVDGSCCIRRTGSLRTGCCP